MYRKTRPDLVLICGILAAATLMLDLFQPIGVAICMLYLITVMVSLWAAQWRFTILVSLLTSLFTVLGFFLSPDGGLIWMDLLNRFLAILGIWAVAFLGLERKKISYQHERILSEMKVLKGLLPICASCKKVRDDQGYWSEIEGYIERRSEAEFSHGLCPDCMKNYFPDSADAPGKKEEPAETRHAAL